MNIQTAHPRDFRRISERPPKQRVDEILAERQRVARSIHSYRARRDFLQLCAEIDHSRNYSIDHTPFESTEVD